MANRRFDVYQYRQILVRRMRQGDSDRDIGRSKTMGRKKIAQVRQIAQERGWLNPDALLPGGKTLASVLARKEALPASCISTLEPWRALVTQWHAAPASKARRSTPRRAAITATPAAIPRCSGSWPSS